MEIDLRCQFLSSKVQASRHPRLVYLLVDILPAGSLVSLPLNVSLVIDCSNSMHIKMVTSEQFNRLAREGQLVEVITDGVPAWRLRSGGDASLGGFPRRIDFVAQALNQIARQLRPVDRFSLVAFAGSAHTLIPAAPGSESNRLIRAAGQLDQLNLGDETELAEGLALGFQELFASDDSGSTNRIILLTDGYTRNVAQCYQWADRARARGVTLSTLGVGSEFNEELLIPLADTTNGHAYYVEKPEDLPGIMQQEFGAALSIACRSLEFKLQLAPNVALRRAHRVLPDAARLDPGANLGGSYTMGLGDLEPSKPPSLLLELILPPLLSGRYQVGQAALSCQDPTHPGSRINRRQQLSLQVEDGIVEDHQPGVARMVKKIAAFDLSTRALADASAQGGPAATRRLREAATRLLDMEEPNLAGVMLHQADAMEQHGQPDAAITKRLRYDTRSVAAADTHTPGEP